MFARSGSSPAVPAGRPTKQTALATKQTLIDSFSRPNTRLAKRGAKASQNNGQAERAVKETKSGAPTKAPKTCTAEEVPTRLEDTPSPRPRPTPSRMAESSSLPMDDAATSEAETEGDTDIPRGGAGDAPSGRTKIRTVEESRKHLEEVCKLDNLW